MCSKPRNEDKDNIDQDITFTGIWPVKYSSLVAGVF